MSQKIAEDKKENDAMMIPSAAIACLYWLKAERPQDYRAWWRILARTWR